ncbi:MAG: DUF3619 family protein [Burkholderiaceae bacterium]|jgi:hypothetical protein|nr:DUF3619 family protein [Burkholderiaceae bacterium]
MNEQEKSVVRLVRQVLREREHALPEHVTDRLASARKLAVSRKKTAPAYLTVFRRLFAGNANGMFRTPLSWQEKLAGALPVLLLVVGLAGIMYHEDQRRMQQIATIDVEVLRDELPPSAYKDGGFRAYSLDRTHRNNT